MTAHSEQFHPGRQRQAAGNAFHLLLQHGLGLAPRIVEDIFRVIRSINTEGVTVLIAEQNALKVLQTAATVYVLENGTVAHAGPSDQLMQSEKIRRSYLGIG